MCGFLGILGRGDVAREIYAGLLALQHRGQDAAGIITYDGAFHLKKGVGLVLGVFNEKNLARLKGPLGLGHVRYPTIGPGGSEDAQPFFVNTPLRIAMAHNGNVTNYWELREELAELSRRHMSSHCDLEVILNIFADRLSQEELSRFSPELLFRAVAGVFDRVQGAYSVVAILPEYGLLAFRDPYGIRPAVIGRRDGSWAVASEGVALDLLRYELLRDLRPGEAVFFDMAGRFFSSQLRAPNLHPCIFEWVYFARPDSILEGIGVYEARLRLGEQLAEECKRAGVKPDVVIAVPDTARAAALPIARGLGVELREGLIKNRYIARTFIMPSQRQRINSVQQKLNPIRSEVTGRRILLVDDSIVRGTTSREIVAMMRRAGAKEVYLAITCPPLRYPCVYGIDMATRGELVAKTHSIPEIREFIGADELIYQTLEGMVEAVGRSRIGFCTACFSGEYPTRPTLKTLARIEAERQSWRGRDEGG